MERHTEMPRAARTESKMHCEKMDFPLLRFLVSPSAPSKSDTRCYVDFAFGNVIINAQVRVHNVAVAVAQDPGMVLILARFLARTCGRNAMKWRPHHPPTWNLFRTSCK
uniref:HDC05690 n=1 Tax=Drosophila melanogaster TaxID=7227 RepID=Q6IGQ6_DROME|nr:TPA_inf: HDC05690 [Drosophila melanogaster]